jgi:hypothetical protein
MDFFFSSGIFYNSTYSMPSVDHTALRYDDILYPPTMELPRKRVAHPDYKFYTETETLFQ